MRTRTWSRNTEDGTYVYCPQVSSRGTAMRVQIEFLGLDLTDTIYYPQYSWTSGLCENWWHYSEQLISFQTPKVCLSVFRGNGCDVCTRTSVSTVKCFLPARNLQHSIALLELHQHHTGKEHWETKSSHSALISQPESQREITRGRWRFCLQEWQRLGSRTRKSMWKEQHYFNSGETEQNIFRLLCTVTLW